MNNNRKDDAVSPVIGVMLMLVVTIVIAALISVFAGGTVGDMEESSNVVMKLEDYAVTTSSISEMVFVHKGGDSLTTSLLKIRVDYSGDTYTFTVNGGGYSSSCTADLNYWVAGEKCTFKDFTSSVNIPFESGTEFVWTIIDSSGQAIAKGTAEV